LVAMLRFCLEALKKNKSRGPGLKADLVVGLFVGLKPHAPSQSKNEQRRNKSNDKATVKVKVKVRTRATTNAKDAKVEREGRGGERVARC